MPLFFGNHALAPPLVTDPGFPRGGGANSRGGGAPTYDFAKFPQKLHGIERIWNPQGAHVPLAPLDPPLPLPQSPMEVVPY